MCPRFFTIAAAPRSKHCPKVTVENRFERTGNLLADFQAYNLIHEMIHFYLGQESLGWDTQPMEKYPLNDCVGFDKFYSWRNPMNYQYYVASMSFS